MVEESFTGVMAQVFERDGSAAKDYLFERNVRVGVTRRPRRPMHAPLGAPASSWRHSTRVHTARDLPPSHPLQCLDGTTMHVRNAPSPACTASLAIAEHVVDTASVDFGWSKK
jgi:2-hydroxyglutarate dehydrogenase